MTTDTNSPEPKRVDDLDAAVLPNIVEAPAAAPAPSPEPEPEPKPAAKPKQQQQAAAATPSRYAVVGGGETDAVMLSRCVYKNPAARKSLTVHHLQRRLAELGYREADADKDGWYGDLTKNAVASFQRDRGFEGDGLMNEQTLNAIFDGDANVTVVID